MLFTILYYFLIFLFLCKFVANCTKVYCTSNACLIGKTVIVTGGNSGMGYHTCLNLASRGARVIIADIADTKNAVEAIKKETNNSNIIGIYLDLGDFSSVRTFASKILLEEDRLDILINNAGCAGFNTKTNDGIYKVMQINYLGHFLLTHLLIPKLKETKNSRVVFVSSLFAFTHNMNSAKDMNTIDKESRTLKLFNILFDYGNSKLCVIAAVKIFAERLKKHGIIVSCCHPGFVQTTILQTTFATYSANNKTNFQYNLETKICFLFVRYFGKTVFEGIQPKLYCALADNIQSGSYIVDGVNFFVPPIIKNKQFVKEVWDESIKLTKLTKTEEVQ